MVYYGDDYTGHLDVCHNITQDLDVDKYLAQARRQMEQKLAVSLEELPDQTQPQDKIVDKFFTKNGPKLFSDDFWGDKEKEKKVSDDSALLGEVTEHLLKQACEQFADELFKDLDVMLDIPSSAQENLGDIEQLPKDPHVEKLVEETMAEIESVIDNLEIPYDFVRFILGKQEVIENNKKNVSDNSEALLKEHNSEENVKSDMRSKEEKPVTTETKKKKKAESRYRCCFFPACQFTLNKTEIIDGKKLKHLKDSHDFKKISNKQPGFYKFPKI